jgi:sugar lactone lactonase YvrE
VGVARSVDDKAAGEERTLAINAKSDKLEDLIDPSAQVERVATGFTFTEGPVWNSRGEFLLFSDMPGDVRRRWTERGRRRGDHEAEQQVQRHGLRRRRQPAGL